MRKQIIRGIVIIVFILFVLAIVLLYRNAWSEKPIDTAGENIDRIIITRGNDVYELSEEKREEFLEIIDKMRFRKYAGDTSVGGGALAPKPGSVYIITIQYKSKNDVTFMINSEAGCISFSNPNGKYYKYKKYKEKAMDELFNSLNN